MDQALNLVMDEAPEVMAAGKYLRLVKRGHWEFADRHTCTGAVAIVAITDERHLLLVEQFRIPLMKNVLELPAGLVGDVAGEEQEELATAARRELFEETGFEACEVRWLVSGPSSAGLTSEVVDFFLATGLKRIHAGGGDHHENIVVHEVPLDGIGQWLDERARAGIMIDPKVYAGLYLACEQDHISRE
jgi:ADP-ribose pyrophosphatase